MKNLSEKLCLGEKQTDRLIRKVFGEGFSNHLSAVRITIAKKLLRGTKKEIGEIAAEVGYQSYTGFYLAFKKKTAKHRCNIERRGIHDPGVSQNEKFCDTPLFPYLALSDRLVEDRADFC